MTNLARLQAAVQGYVLDHAGMVHDRIVGTDRADAAERLGVYADGYRLRLIEVLAADYPGLRRLLSDDQFAVLARDYIETHPSTWRSVRWYGCQLAEFLAVNTPYRGQPILADLAAFEWAQGEAFDAADAPAVAVADLAALSPEAWAAMRIHFRPAVRRLSLGWNAPLIWSALERDEVCPQPAPMKAAWLIWRNDFQVYWRSLEPPEARAMETAWAGRTFSELCEGLCTHLDSAEAPAQAAAMLKRWVVDGLVGGVETA